MSNKGQLFQALILVCSKRKGGGGKSLLARGTHPILLQIYFVILYFFPLAGGMCPLVPPPPPHPPLMIHQHAHTYLLDSTMYVIARRKWGKQSTNYRKPGWLWTCVKKKKLYTLQKSKIMQHDFDRLYFFYPGFVFMKLDIPGKPLDLPFNWYLIWWDCFTEACLGSVNRGQCQKGKLAKLIGVQCMGIACYMYVMFCAFLLWAYARVPTAHSLYIPKSSEAKCWILNNDAILNLTLRLIKSLCARPCQTIITNNIPIERKIDRLSNDRPT